MHYELIPNMLRDRLLPMMEIFAAAATGAFPTDVLVSN
jgi:hypothetical protein